MPDPGVHPLAKLAPLQPSLPSNCANRLKFLELDVLPSENHRLSADLVVSEIEILPKNGLLFILASRLTKDIYRHQVT